MLFTNSTVKNGRFRIIQRVGIIDRSVVYEAFDDLHSTNVIIAETLLATTRVFTAADREAQARRSEQNFLLSKLITSDRFIRHAEHFAEIDRHYIVTESVGRLTSLLSCDRWSCSEGELAAEIDAWLKMADEIRHRFPLISHVEITPASIRVGEDHIPRLLFFGISDTSSATHGDNSDDGTDLAYLPLEAIWPQLDSASQKAFSNSYNDYSLELLESPCDVTAEIYSIAAMMFRLATGQAPPNALERSIELLDGRPDPMIAAIESSRFSLALCGYFARSLQIRRESRFRGTAEARAALCDLIASSPAKSAADEFDLLELPAVPLAIPARQSLRKTSTAEPQPKTSPPAAELPVQIVERPVDTHRTPEAAAQRNFENSLIKHDVYYAPAKLTSRTDVTPRLPSVPKFRSSNTVVPARLYRVSAALAVALILVAAGIYGYLSLGQSTIDYAAPQATIAPDVKPTAAITPQTGDSIDQVPSRLTATEPLPPSGSDPSAESATHSEKTLRPSVAGSKQPSRPIEKTTGKTTPKQKKVITVDDLISDN